MRKIWARYNFGPSGCFTHCLKPDGFTACPLSQPYTQPGENTAASEMPCWDRNLPPNPDLSLCLSPLGSADSQPRWFADSPMQTVWVTSVWLFFNFPLNWHCSGANVTEQAIAGAVQAESKTAIKPLAFYSLTLQSYKIHIALSFISACLVLILATKPSILELKAQLITWLTTVAVGSLGREALAPSIAYCIQLHFQVSVSQLLPKRVSGAAEMWSPPPPCTQCWSDWLIRQRLGYLCHW